MPQDTQLAHRVLQNLALPYQTNVSPTLTDPHFVNGSFDILTSIAGYAERRPGFSQNVEPTPTTFNNLQRLFTWDTFNGVFYVMACDIDASNFAKVYKMQVGADNSFVLIYTEPTPTGSCYDFVNSNNTLYFSNGFYVRKWDPVNGVSNWGIAPYAASSVASANAGAGANLSTGIWTGLAWTNPGLAVGAGTPPFATNGPTSQGAGFSQFLKLTGYTGGGFPINAGSTIQSISVTVTALYSSTGTIFPECILYLLQNGNVVGQTATPFSPTTSSTAIVLSNLNIAGAGFNPSNVNDTTNFGVLITAVPGFGGTGAYTVTIKSATVTVASSGGPVVTLSGTGITATTGFQYVICYGNTNTGHVGSPCPPSNLVKPSNQSMLIPVLASTDPQVNQIRIFRTTDSATGLGGQAYFEIPASPVPNANATITDAALDINLNILSIAPTPTFNDPPSFVPNGGLKGLVYFSGRIWGFTGNQVWFTALEECTIGVPEESMPSGIAGNFWSFDEPVQALEVAGIGTNQGLAVLSGGRLYGVQGNSLDTFVRFQISNRRGCRSRTNISALGGMMAWLDTAGQVWATDGTNLNELSTLIRPTTSQFDQTTSSVTFHSAGRFHWLVISANSLLFVYDVDTDQWMPPWTFSAKYIYSGEIGPGDYVLMASTGTKAVFMSDAGVAGTYNDNGAVYEPSISLGLLSVVPDYGSRFSYIGVGSYNEPTRTGYPVTFQITKSGPPNIEIFICQDDDPTLSATPFLEITRNLVDTSVAYNRPNGVSIRQLVYQTLQPASRWIGMFIQFANADQVDNIYEIFMAYKALGGR